MQPIKILIVEDENIIAQDIAALVTDWGYDLVGVASSFEEAWHIFEDQKPDIALVDIQISGNIDGVQMVKRFNEVRRIPIIYLTAQADFQTVERAKTTQPAAYLLKPFDERHLNISLDLAFENFSKQMTPQYQDLVETPKTEKQASLPTKLTADIILKNDSSIFIKQNYRFIKLKTSELVYVEADRNHSFLVTIKHRYLIRLPLTTILERLDLAHLVRVHRSFAVSVWFVDEFDETEIIANGKSIPFSSAFREDFLQHFKVK
jgi:two-component system, response regulator PdtaR